MPKPRRLTIGPLPAPNLAAEAERQRKVRQAQIDAMLVEVKDG